MSVTAGEARPGGLCQVRAWPVCVSVTVRTYSTVVVAAAKTQWWPLTPQPSRTLTSSSQLPGEKNQNRPESSAATPGTTEPGPAPLEVRPRDVKALAGAGENVFRAVQALPSVFGTDELDSRLAVRGGGPDQNLALRRAAKVQTAILDDGKGRKLPGFDLRSGFNFNMVATGRSDEGLVIVLDQPDTEVEEQRGRLVKAWLTGKSRRRTPTR